MGPDIFLSYFWFRKPHKKCHISLLADKGHIYKIVYVHASACVCMHAHVCACAHVCKWTVSGSWKRNFVAGFADSLPSPAAGRADSELFKPNIWPLRFIGHCDRLLLTPHLLTLSSLAHGHIWHFVHFASSPSISSSYSLAFLKFIPVPTQLPNAQC